MITIIDGGFQTTVQDLGRFGSYHLGIPPSGAADLYSFKIGNMLLGNPLTYAGLEIILIGPTLHFQKDTVISVTGAKAMPKINGKPIPMWETVKVQADDILTFSPIHEGVCTYVCISGGIDVPTVLDSRSTYSSSQIGGYHGRKLRKGDLLATFAPLPGAFKTIGKQIPSVYIPSFLNEIELRIVLGLSSYQLSDDGIRVFLNSKWKVSFDSNRVAYRCNGGKLSYQSTTYWGAGNSTANVVDICYPIGGVVIPNPEEVIILLHDATTGGGFVTAGVIFSSDLNRLSQVRPNASIQFSSIIPEQALQIRMEEKQRLFTLTELLK